MNKNKFRVVFNRVRGLMMVIAEISSNRQTGGETTSSISVPEIVLASLRPIAFFMLILSGQVMVINSALADIIADPGAPANQRPVIVQTANGLPLVNIQTPSAAGVSRNTYKQFDVKAQGAILNNSNTNVQTQLGGWIQGNPYLAGGTAKVILNEVNSNNPSLLNGYVEVAGSRAQVVIANPAGISCDGCGFINASRTTLTTGTPIMNSGYLLGYRVGGGTISFLGGGLDTSQADFTDVIARAVEVNAGIWANALNITTGTNQVSVDSNGNQNTITHIAPSIGSTAPAFAVDVAALGGMYAGKIHMIGTEAGLGVSNAGTIGASVGEVTIDVNGQLINAGTIASNTQTSLQATDITNTGGTVSAGQLLTIEADQLTGDGSLLSGGDAVVTLVDDYTHTGELQADGNLTFTTAGNIWNQAQMLAGNDLVLNAQDINNQNTIYANNALTLNADNIENTATAEIAGLNTYVNATGTLTNRGLIDGSDTFLTADTLNNIGTGSIFGDHLAIKVATLNNDSEIINSIPSAGVIAARDRLDIGAQTINNQNDSLIFSAGDMSIGGTLDASQQAVSNGDTLNNISASIEALGNLEINVDNIDNKRSDFAITRQASTTLPDDFELLQYNAALEFFWPYSETNPINWRNFVRDRYLNSINNLLGGTLNSTYRSELAALVNAQSRSVYEDSINIWNLLLNKIKVDHPEYITTMAQTLSSQTFPLKTYNQLCRDDECDYVSYNVTQRTDYIDTVTSDSSAAMISAGGNAIINSGKITNEYSTIQSGGDFTLTGTNLVNQGAELYLQTDTIRSAHVIHWTNRDHGTTVSGGSTSKLIGTAPAIISAGGELTGSFTGNIDNVAIREHSALVPTTSTTVPESSTVSLPTNSLFQTNPDATSHYLIETNPRFANFKTWLSSDYMLSQLSYDPATTTKRLGDGFYEQRLIREQISQLTGRRFLEGYASDETQYQALMENGVTYAQQYQLIPGIALSAAQIAQLTSDIVWLVEKTVTLADGTTTTVLTPQLYVLPKIGDLSPSGALIAGNNVDLKLGSIFNEDGQVVADQGTFKNSGTVAGRMVVAINSDNIQNLGGLIMAGDAIDLQAKQDIVMQGTTTDIDIRQQGTAHYVKQTSVNRMAGLYVSNSNATLSLDAGRDITLNAAYVENAGADGTTTFKAGNNINLGVVQETQKTYGLNKNSWSKTRSTNQVGSQIIANGDISMEAQQDINIKAGNISSDNGKLAIDAGDDVNITTGEATYESEAFRKIKKSGGFSSTKKTYHDTVDSKTNISSTLSADSISINAGKTGDGDVPNVNGDIKITGSNVVATNDVDLNATGDISIIAAVDTHDETHLKKVKSSGFAASGASISYGTRKMSSNTDTQQTTSVGSTVGSINGDVNIKTGLGGETGTYTQVGSDVIAPQGDINIEAQQVNIVAAQDTFDSETETKFKQTGITLAITSPIISAIQTAQQMSKAASETDDTRMKALAAGTAALSAKNAVDALGRVDQYGNVPTAGNTGPDDLVNVREATAAEQVGGINLSLSLGTSKNSSKTTQTSTTAASSHVIAGGDINITAKGAGKDSDVNVIGSQIKAGENVSIKADDQVNLIAAKNTETLDSKNKGSSASLGVSFGTDGLLFTASASGSKGKANGTDVTWTETQVEAGNKVTLESGTDTNLIGAQVTGNQVIADVGTSGSGNLNIQSLQDTSTYKDKQQSVGGSISVGAGRWGGSFNYSDGKTKSDYASVNEQAGILAGDGGFQVNVAGNTNLTGAVIASTDSAIQDDKNNLTTETLTVSDIKNKAEYEAESMSMSVGGGTQSGKPTLTGAGVGSDNGDASSVTVSGISSGTVNITDSNQQIALTGKDSVSTVATLNRDVKVNNSGEAVDSQGNSTANTIAQIFDKEKVAQEIKAQVQITQAFSQQAPIALATFASDQTKPYKDATKTLEDAKAQLTTETDPDKQEQLQNIISQSEQIIAENQDTYDKWKENGDYRIASNIIIAAIGGGVSSAIGAVTKESLSWAADKMRQAMIEDSMKFPGVIGTDGKVISNISGDSVGVNGDNTKVAGGRIVLVDWCDQGRCVEDKSTVSGYAEDEYGRVKLTMSLDEFKALPIYDARRSPLGGNQGDTGQMDMLGIRFDYVAGSFWDKLAEAYSGTHDTLNSFIWYDELGNSKKLDGALIGEIGKVTNITNVPLATPFALSVLLPPEVWSAVFTFIKSNN